ncbi:MAG: glucodextranase DOMON-like domain-containing protein [Candidatus Thermoplasmatota archaeon]
MNKIFSLIIFLLFFLSLFPLSNAIKIDGELSDWKIEELRGEKAGKKFYFTFDLTTLYFGWEGNDWASEGDLFIYLNTSSLGNYESSSWNGFHSLPFQADYGFCLENSNYWDLRKYDNDWKISKEKPGETYIGWSGNKNTELSLPLSLIGNPNKIEFIVFAQWEEALNVFASFPIENNASNNGRECFEYYYQVYFTNGTIFVKKRLEIIEEPVEPSPDALNLAIIWHFHQPYYKNVLSGFYELPWVRVHASQEYIDHPKILSKHPRINLTINLVPSLIEQIEDYANNDVMDRHLAWARNNALITNLTSIDRATAQFEFFWNPAWVYNTSYPSSKTYYSLYNKTLHNLKPETIGIDKPLPSNEFLDLEVLWFLFQISPWIVEGKYSKEDELPDIKALHYKGSNYTIEDLELVLKRQKEVIKKVMPAYKALNNVEFTTSPYYHPILPLLMANEWTMEDKHKVVKGIWYDDVVAQLNASVKLYSKYFSKSPLGLWPSEQAVSMDIIEPVVDAGFKWIVTDELILKQSGVDISDLNNLYKAYSIKKDGKEIKIIFRDREISDRISWQYGKKKAKDAVDDFIGYLSEKKSKLIDPKNSLVTVALDGENWMFMSPFEDGGRVFLEELYSRLEKTNWIRTVKVWDYISTHSSANLENLATGSWVDGNLRTWAGEEEESLAWERLIEARKALLSSGSKDERALEGIYAVEGSDWFWWYGLDQDSGYDELWDELYKIHLTSIYNAIDLALPPYLKNLRLAPMLPKVQSSGIIEPAIDGIALPGEWELSAIYEFEKSEIKKILTGYNTRNIYIAIELKKNASELWNDKTKEVGIYFSSLNIENMNILGANFLSQYAKLPLNFPGRYYLTLLLDEVLSTGKTGYSIFSSNGDENWTWKVTFGSDLGKAGINEIIEIEIPFSSIEMQPGARARIKVAIANLTEKSEDITPLPIEIFIPREISPELEIVRLDDDIGDENCIYPTAEDFSPFKGLFDITYVKVSITDFDLIFRFGFKEMTNVWSMKYGYSHQIVQIYIDKDRVLGSGNIDMLDGAYAQVTNDFAWELAISARGEEIYVVTQEGRQITTGVETRGDLEKKEITVIASKSLVGNDITKYGYVIVSGSQDGFGIGKWRVIDEKPSRWTLGGGSDSKYDPNIIDLILLEGMEQKKILSGYDIASKKLAQIPGITLPEMKQQIYGIKVSGITATTAIITWYTTQPGETYIEYGESTHYSYVIKDENITNYHEVILRALEPKKTYYFKVKAQEESSEELSFSTTGIEDKSAPMILLPSIEGITNTSAIVVWTTDEFAKGKVEYGETKDLGKIAELEYGWSKSHRIEIKNLTPGKIYYYKIITFDSSGNINNSAINSFKTSGEEIKEKETIARDNSCLIAIVILIAILISLLILKKIKELRDKKMIGGK